MDGTAPLPAIPSVRRIKDRSGPLFDSDLERSNDRTIEQFISRSVFTVARYPLETHPRGRGLPGKISAKNLLAARPALIS